MHKSLVAIAAASTVLIASSMARADEPATPTSPPATSTAAPVAASTAAPVKEQTPAVAKRSVLPIVTAAAGGTVFLVGLGFLSLASTKDSQAKTNDSVDSTVRSVGMSSSGDGRKAREDAASARSTGTILLASGAIVAAGGLVWFFVDGQQVKAKNAALRVIPAVGATSAGAYLQGTF